MHLGNAGGSARDKSAFSSTCNPLLGQIDGFSTKQEEV